MPHLIGIDVGTTGSKVLVIDEEGRVRGSYTAEYPLYTPKPGWSEQHPEDWWRATVKAVKEAVKRSGVDPSSIEGISLTGQMHGLVILDKNYDIILSLIHI